MNEYKCPSCSHTFNATNTRPKDGKLLECCPSCGEALPKGFRYNKDYLHQFSCQNCGKIKPAAELRPIGLATTFISAFGGGIMTKVCKSCSPEVNFFGWFILGLFALLFISNIYIK